MTHGRPTGSEPRSHRMWLRPAGPTSRPARALRRPVPYGRRLCPQGAPASASGCRRSGRRRRTGTPAREGPPLRRPPGAPRPCRPGDPASTGHCGRRGDDRSRRQPGIHRRHHPPGCCHRRHRCLGHRPGAGPPGQVHRRSSPPGAGPRLPHWPASPHRRRGRLLFPNVRGDRRPTARGEPRPDRTTRPRHPTSCVPSRRRLPAGPNRESDRWRRPRWARTRPGAPDPSRRPWAASARSAPGAGNGEVPCPAWREPTGPSAGRRLGGRSATGPGAVATGC